MIIMSREPSADAKVQYPSIPELKDGFEELTNRIARKAKLKFRGRKLRSGPLHNAVLLHFLTLPEARQIEIAEAGLRRYEALLQFDEPQENLGQVLADSVGAGSARPPAGLVVKAGPKAAPVGDQPKERQLGQVYISYDTTKNAAAAAARAAEEAGGDDADRLKGDEHAVGKRRRSPGGK